MQVNVVIVTYNRLGLLKKCLDSVNKQTVPINKIFIVNNGSTDGTTEWLSELSNVTVIHQENVGSAGGFNTGMTAAYEDGGDWMWIMDDDVTVAPDCLEQLLKYSHLSQCLNPRKYYADGVEFYWESLLDIDSGNVGQLNNISFKNGKDVCFVNVGCFEGMLLHRDIITAIGVPDKRFFIVYDDTMYGFLASMHTNVAYVKSAVMYTDKVSTGNYESDFYLYYYIRNRHLVKEYIYKYFPRANKRTMNILFNLYVLKKLLLLPLKSRKGIGKKLTTMKVVLKAYNDYRNKRTGRGYLPR